MAKWIERLEQSGKDAIGRTDKTARTPLVSVLAVPSDTSTRDMRCKIAAVAAQSLMTREQADACHFPSWSDAEIEAFISRRDRLIRWGYAEQDAEVLAERLTLRDREQDDRRLCAECRHGQAAHCPNGHPLAADVLQRCPHFEEPGL